MGIIESFTNTGTRFLFNTLIYQKMGAHRDVCIAHDNTVYTIDKNQIHHCFYGIADCIKKAPNYRESLMKRKHVFTSHDVKTIFEITKADQLYSATLTLQYKDMILLESHFTDRDIVIYCQSLVVNNMDLIPPILYEWLNPILTRYIHWLVSEIDPMIYVSMVVRKKSLIVYLERHSDHLIINYKKSVKLPLQHMMKSLEDTIKRFENFHVDNHYKGVDMYQEVYKVKNRHITCILNTYRISKNNECIFDIKFTLENNSSLSFGICIETALNNLDSLHETNTFFIGIGEEKTFKAVVEDMLPYFREKFLYIKTLLQLTEDTRLRRFPQNI